MLIRVTYPVHLLVLSPVRCVEGLNGKAFGNAMLESKECVALFHTDVEALEFADRFEMNDATIGVCHDRQSLFATLRRAHTQFRFRYAGFAAPDDSGEYFVFPIERAQDFL